MKAIANGIEVHYEVEGSGPWVTLSHSLACTLQMWAPQVAALRQRYTVLRYDTRGHGQTEATAPPYTFDTLADDVLALWDALGVAQSHFVGISMGGMIGQHLALRAAQRLRSLTLVDTTSRYPPQARATWDERLRIVAQQGMEAMVAPTLPRWFTDPFRAAQPQLMASYAEMVRRTPPAGYSGCIGAIAAMDVTERLETLRLPALVVVGEQDLGTPVAMAQQIAAHLPGARLEILPQAAHLASVEQAGRFNRLLTDFLDAH